MEIKTKLNIGDKMYFIHKIEGVEINSCISCNGTGKITLASGKTFNCPECYGEGHFKKITTKQWRPLDDRNNVISMYGQPVGKIEISITKDGRKKNPDIDIKYTPKGFGNFFQEEDVFASHEEAQAECDRRNKALQEGLHG